MNQIYKSFKGTAWGCEDCGGVATTWEKERARRENLSDCWQIRVESKL